MNFTSDILPYVIGVVIVVLSVFLGLGNISKDTFLAIIIALLGIEGVTTHAIASKRLKALGKAQGLK